MESDTPRTDAEVKRISAELDGDGDDAAYALDQMSVLCRKLERDLAAMKQQRDEARQEVCRHASLRSIQLFGVHHTPKEHAAERGWDCFAQQEWGGA